jgi:hypothetical protein
MELAVTGFVFTLGRDAKYPSHPSLPALDGVSIEGKR